MPPISFTNFDSSLLRTINGGQIIQDAVLYGAERLGSDFTVLKTKDKAPLVSIDVKDGWAAASDTFTGKNVLDVTSRFASFKEGDIDIEFTLSDIKKMYQSYLGQIKAPGKDLSDVYSNPFELFFLNEIIARHFEMVRMNTSWKGVYNPVGTGAAALTDGFITKFTAGRAAGGDIAASHVFTGAALTDANAYAQFNGVAELVNSVSPKLLNDGLNIYSSTTAYDKYRRNRRTLFPNHVSPDARPANLDDYSTITFVQDPGLAGKDTIVIAPKKNLLFVANEDPGAYTINIVKQVKSYQMSIRVSLDFDYASPDWVFLNDKI